MAKRESAKLVSPLYESGSMNGPAAGPSGGVAPNDPFGYMTNPGMKAPSGSPADRGASSSGTRATAK